VASNPDALIGSGTSFNARRVMKGDRKRERDAAESGSNVREAAQPGGGREQPGDPFTSRREAAVPRSEEAGEDSNARRAADKDDVDPVSAPARRTLSEEKDDD
jgi:hypothetical protein